MSKSRIRKPRDGGRAARRKHETQSRLLQAAFRLVAEKGVDAVSINEITEAADVGFGSFYNHFESKEAIYATVINWAFESFADRLDRGVSGISDPAEVIAVCARRTMWRAQRERIWGQFLIHEGLSARALQHGLAPRLLRDVQRGITAERFAVADPLVSSICVGGAVLTAIAVELHFGSSLNHLSTLRKVSGTHRQRLPERIASALLQMLGLDRSEANRIAGRPLPKDSVGLEPPRDASVASLRGIRPSPA
jgi:AcrR family transcriptional regulator